MSGMLTTAVSGLMAFQRALTTTSNNISNVNTEGYSRQRVELNDSPSQFYGDGFVGTGVHVKNITRSYDSFITTQIQSSASAFGDVDSYKGYADQVDNLVSHQDTGVAPALQSFLNSVNDVANEPSSLAARENMLVEAESFAYRVGVVGARMEEIGSQVTADLDGYTQEINSYTSAIASLNQRISDSLSLATGSQAPNKLMDERDLMLKKLSTLTDITIANHDNGKIGVMLSDGQSLVLDDKAATLSLKANEHDPSKMDIYMVPAAGSIAENVTSKFRGGEISGALRFREELLEPAQQKLGAMVASMAIEFNAVHKEGYDYSGDAGLALFKFGNMDAYGNTEVPVSQVAGNESANTTAGFQLQAALSTDKADSAYIDTSDYLLKVTDNGGTNKYTLERLSDGTEIELALNRDTADTTNNGTASTSITYSSGTTALNATGGALSDAEDGVYGELVAGASDNLPGITLKLKIDSGTGNIIEPSVGDEFFIRPTFKSAQHLQVNITDAKKVAAATNLDTDGVTVINGPMIGDNRNALKLADLANETNMFNGSAGYQEVYGQMVSKVGGLTHAADISVTAQESLYNNALSSREAIAGVNLDEEAANLMKYQQAYQAAAQAISSANNMFNTLLQAVN